MITNNDDLLDIGTKVRKTSPKPFKSGNKINTIKGYIIHPILKVVSYTFEEDDSYVEAKRCVPFSISTETILYNILSNTDVNLKSIYGFSCDNYNKDIILKVISDIYHQTFKTTFQFNIKLNNVVETFTVNILSWIVPYLLPLDNMSRDWLIAEEGEYPEL